MKRLAAACLLWAAALPAAEVYEYWMQPCAGDAAAHSGCKPADAELARWALSAWEKTGGSGLRFSPAASEDGAGIRIYWLGRTPQLYGDAHWAWVKGKRLWEIDVQADLSQFGPPIEAAGKRDPLFRDTVVYLTFLHEIGHVLGIPHTDDFTDIMYSFQYGGDVLEYFNRYRRALKQRSDIREHAGISDADRARITWRYAGR